MSRLQPVSVNQHQSKRWQRYASYSFAAADAMCPIVPLELPRVMMTLPIGLVASEDGAVVVALQGLEPGHNLLVSPEGRWQGEYVPAFYRGYPFSLVEAEQGKQVLCIDEDSGLLSDHEGEPFFVDGKPAPALAEILQFLSQVHASQQAGHKQCALLKKFGLIRPWPIALDTSQGERQVAGLSCIDEQAFNRLPGEALQALRDAGALPLVYAQLFSMQHLPKLASMTHSYAEALRQHAVKQEAVESANFGFLNQGGTISFCGLE